MSFRSIAVVPDSRTACPLIASAAWAAALLKAEVISACWRWRKLEYVAGRARPEDAKALAWQCALRIGKELDLPPATQRWFNEYVVDGGYLPRRRPDTAKRDRLLVHRLEAVARLTQAEAVRRVATMRGVEPKAVENNLYR